MDFESVVTPYLDGTGSSRYSTVQAFPYFTRGEEWTPLEQSDWDDWISGFWPGIHWMAQQHGPMDLEDALELTREVQPIYEQNINTGFRYQYSWVPAYEATGNPKYKQKALDAARRLNECFRPGLSLYCSRNDSPNTIRAANDAFMNIPLLLWASEASPNGSRYRTTIQKFLERATKLFVKDNGAVRHCIVFDREQQTPRAVQSPQGIPGGCWSRGLAWTVSGLTLGGLYLDRSDFLEKARRIVNFHERNTYSKIPPFDYSVSCLKQPSLTDTSAGAILASSLLVHGTLRDEPELKDKGQTILKTLLKDYRRSADRAGLIDGGCFHYPEEEGINEALIWGDFFTLEALYLNEYEQLPLHLKWLDQRAAVRAKAS